MKKPPTKLAAFVKEMRRKHHLTQTDLADKSGVGLNPRMQLIITDSFLPVEMQSRFFEIIENNLYALKSEF